MTTTPRTRVSLSSEELDLLDDVIQYYRASDMGGGDRDDCRSRHLLRAIDRRLDAGRDRLLRETYPE